MFLASKPSAPRSVKVTCDCTSTCMDWCSDSPRYDLPSMPGAILLGATGRTD